MLVKIIIVIIKIIVIVIIIIFENIKAENSTRLLCKYHSQINCSCFIMLLFVIVLKCFVILKVRPNNEVEAPVVRISNNDREIQVKIESEFRMNDEQANNVIRAP